MLLVCSLSLLLSLLSLLYLSFLVSKLLVLLLLLSILVLSLLSLLLLLVLLLLFVLSVSVLVSVYPARRAGTRSSGGAAGWSPGREDRGNIYIYIHI